MVVPTLVNFVDGHGADWWQLVAATDGLVNGHCGNSGADLDGLLPVGLSPVDDAEWSVVGCRAASR